MFSSLLLKLSFRFSFFLQLLEPFIEIVIYLISAKNYAIPGGPQGTASIDYEKSTNIYGKKNMKRWQHTSR